MNSLSTFLYARPSLIEGVARLIDFGNTLQEYNTSLTGEQADALAFAVDWQVIGDEFRSVMLSYEQLEAQITDELMVEAQKSLELAS